MFKIDDFKIDVLRNFKKVTGKHLFWTLCLMNLPVLRPATLLKSDSNIDVFL